jgi:hypothetical protein
VFNLRRYVLAGFVLAPPADKFARAAWGTALPNAVIPVKAGPGRIGHRLFFFLRWGFVVRQYFVIKRQKQANRTGDRAFQLIDSVELADGKAKVQRRFRAARREPYPVYQGKILRMRHSVGLFSRCHAGVFSVFLRVADRAASVEVVPGRGGNPCRARIF